MPRSSPGAIAEAFTFTFWFASCDGVVATCGSVRNSMYPKYDTAAVAVATSRITIAARRIFLCVWLFMFVT